MSNKLQFRVSSALKDIIGKDLINDDFIAVFELVKNSYDAHASEVDIIFEDIYGETPKITIKDDGKGMNYEDLVNKWLFVAYSAKKEGTEEENYDYRDKIKVKRAYAGAKGIGRFSCDRLGSYLYLESTKDEKGSKTEVLMTDWEQFEDSLKDEFINIDVEHQTIENKKISHGTILEVTKLRSNWDRQKLLRLKAALAKLINPNTHNEQDTFKIKLHVKEEIEGDNKKSDYDEIVNGNIENLIFESLNLKTTKIVSKVHSEEEKKITFTLYEGGELVYEIIEKNPFSHLHDVELVLYFMNHSAKLTFARRMGIDVINYGHIFVYKNGLRIYPYGEKGADPFNMDVRKSQGRTRYLGTRETIGFISITEPNDRLHETTSRGDGLEKSEAYLDMYEWFLVSLRRVEKYIIDIVDWGNDLSKNDYINLDSLERKTALLKLIKNLSRANNIIDFNISPEILDILHKKTKGSAKNKLSNLTKNIESGSFDKEAALEEIKAVEQKVQDLERKKKESEAEALQKIEENKKLADTLEAAEKKGAFQGALIGTDKERIIGLQHQIFHSSGRINRNIHLLIRDLPPEALTKKQQKRLNVISLESSKINSIANFVTKANFNLKASKLTEDLIAFITDYLNEIYIFEGAIIDSSLKINITNNKNETHEREFRPLEITTVIDNFITNAENAEAKIITFDFSIIKKQLVLSVSDNGKGIPENNVAKVFDLGFTTTSGSGIGLSVTHDLITKMKGKIEIDSLKKPTTFRITL